MNDNSYLYEEVRNRIRFMNVFDDDKKTIEEKMKEDPETRKEIRIYEIEEKVAHLIVCVDYLSKAVEEILKHIIGEKDER